MNILTLPVFIRWKDVRSWKEIQINQKTAENSNTGDFPKSKDEYLKGRVVNKNYSSNFFRKYVLYYSSVQNTALFSFFNFEYSISSILFFIENIYFYTIYADYDIFPQLFQFLLTSLPSGLIPSLSLIKKTKRHQRNKIK